MTTDGVDTRKDRQTDRQTDKDYGCVVNLQDQELTDSNACKQRHND